MARAKTPSFTVTLKLEETASQAAELDRRLDAAARLHNALADHANEALQVLRRNGRHRSALRRRRPLAEEWAPYRDRMRALEERIGELASVPAADLGRDGRAGLKAARSELARLKRESAPIREALDAIDAELALVRERFGLTKGALERYAEEGKRRQGLERRLSANECQKVADRVWQGVEKCLFEGASKVSFVPRDEIRSVEGKSNRQGIRLAQDANGRWELAWATQWRDKATGALRRDVVRCPVTVRRSDLFAQEALATCRVKYCRVLRQWSGGRPRHYVQAVLEGTPPDTKHREASGLRGGIDRGTATLAVVNEEGECLLVETNSMCSEAVRASEARQAELQRRMDASRRATNPQNYNADGTCKRGPKRWHRSKAYLRLLAQLRSERRRCAALRKQECDRTANRVLAMCGDIAWEPMDFRSLAKRARRTGKRDPATGRERPRRRYGRSVAAHTPAQVSQAIERKLAYRGRAVREVDLRTYRASQLDHTTGELKRAPLSERWKEVGGHRVQRDLYSAFLLCHPGAGLASPDPSLCDAAFPAFLAGHDRCVASMHEQGLSCPGSFGF